MLIRPDGETLDAFGYEAENNYSDLAMEESHTQWFYFRRFKMKLFRQGGVGRTLMLEDETGKKGLSAKTVFTGAIKYLKNDLLKESEKRISGGPGVIAAFKENHMEDYIDLFRDFELNKRDISTKKSGGKINLSMPVALVETVMEVTGKTIKETILGSAYRERIQLHGNKIRVDVDIVIKLFSEPVTSILNHVSTLLEESAVRGCNTIVMVGGFSESPILQERVQKHFSGMSVIVPNEAGLAVLKSAVIFGHSPTNIAQRVCKFTYWYDTTHIYSDTCSHSTGRRETNENGDIRCYDIFKIQAKVGEKVKFYEEGPESIVSPISASQNAIGFEIYASLNPKPSHTTEKGCSEIGYLEIPINDTSLGKGRKFGVRFIFGGTEIEVKVEDKADKQVFRKRVDFL
ncbi:heat shock 70 kDa protein 12B-like [Mya arenaria]|uniref:heat shock 70 kDa protein 12B-like n=1 Tax=Mya arenaria TaxID=6604 RepID=UPI0022E151B6|nr:heat shock 70 kDa protein 12B-like [Mya arenaria]